VSFADWVNNGWLVAHKSSKQEIGNLLGIVARDLKDSQAKDVSDDWRFAIAYNATLGKDAKFIRAFDAFRKKRNVSSYDIGGGISHREVEEMIGIAQSLQQDVEQWIRTNHASLL
jgi:hypothetical protein